jgi:DNA-binding MarR family transcriptional regulator
VTASASDDVNLGLLMFIPYRFMESAVMAALKAHGHDIGLNQARVFARINPEGSRLSELADAAQLSKQTVGSIVDQLERAGYVRRDRDPDDARARLVSIAPRGRELIDLSAPVVREVEAAWEAHLGRARTRQLRKTLQELRSITDPFAVPTTTLPSTAR